MTLSDRQVKDFHDAGFITGLRVFTRSEVTRYRLQFDQLEAKRGQEYCANKSSNPHQTERFVWQLASDPRVLDCVGSLLGDDVLLLATRFFCKYGGSPSFTGWHQDATYWQLESPTTLSVWYAIDDSHRENGCMRVLPGSHLCQFRDQGQSNVPGNMLSRDQNIQLSPSEEQAIVDIELESGMLSFHDGRLVHGSEPNRSKVRRCGLVCIYLPGNIRQVPNRERKRWVAIPVRGEARGTNLAMGPPPF